jgi:hypothetical protein
LTRKIKFFFAAGENEPLQGGLVGDQRSFFPPRRWPCIFTLFAAKHEPLTDDNALLIIAAMKWAIILFVSVVLALIYLRFASSLVCKNESAVRRYIQQQGKKDKRLEQLKVAAL